MSEIELEAITDKDDLEPIKAVGEPETDSKKSPTFKIETEQDLRRLLSIMKGQDPDAQQLLNKFMDFENKVERSNFPNHGIVHLMAFLDFASITLFPYPEYKNNPFSQLRDSVATAFMAKSGWKANGFVEIVKQTPSLSELQALNESIAPKGLRERFFGGKSNE